SFANFAGTTINLCLGDEATPKNGEPPILTFGIPLDWAEICEYLEREWTGSEGPIEDKEFRLRGISIAFRHGERSPLTTANAESACVPFREEDRREFAKYKELVESDDFQYFLHHDTKFANFSKLPSHSECFPRQMTAEGALQHVKLGKYIRSKYSASSIFSADSRLNVSITSSQFNRTFQSAIAFSSSFLFPSRISIPQIYIKASNFTFMCTSEKCRCDPAPKWRHQYEQEYYKYFQTRSPEHLRSFAKILRMQPAFNGSLDLFQIMDVALGRYICRRQTLPCFDGACLTLDYIGQLINETTIRGKVMYDEGDRYIARRLQLVEAYGVLYHIAETVGKLRKFPHTNVIQIFSGHDVMVAPLLRVMGIEFIDPPHYASRIVVEYYEAAGSSSTKHSILLRFIYNGVDITKKVNFCKTALKSKLCPAQLLEDFVQNKIFSSLGIASLKDICDIGYHVVVSCTNEKRELRFLMSRSTNHFGGAIQNGSAVLEAQGSAFYSDPESPMSSLEGPCCSSPRSSISDFDELPPPIVAKIPSEDGISESWFRNKLRRASSAWSNWRSSEPTETKSSTWKNKISSAWNNIKYSEKWMHLANDDYSSDGFKKIVLLGLIYCPEDSECVCGMDFIDFYRDYYTRIWITYRMGMPPLPGTQITSDCGWGCMIRTTQMAIAQALVVNRMTRGWRYYGRKHSALRKDMGYQTRTDPFYEAQLEILKLFEDCPSAPLGIHRLVEISSRDNPSENSVGRWYAPSEVLSLMKKALRQSASPLTSDLSLMLAVDGRVVVGDAERESRAWAKRLLLFVPLRLGTTSVNPVYHDHIRHILSLKSCLGILGGRPDHSLYFIGYYGRHVIYLDPHVAHDYVPISSWDESSPPPEQAAQAQKHVIYLDPHVAHDYVPISSWDESSPPPEQAAQEQKKRPKHPLSSYHCRSLSKLPMKDMDPSCVVGFMFKTKEELDKTFQMLNLNQVVDVDLGPGEGSKRTRDPLFTVQYQETASFDYMREVSEDERQQALEHGFELL
ncbi:histidine acid phosphatase, partial [Oesophagostomum dentatum]